MAAPEPAKLRRGWTTGACAAAAARAAFAALLTGRFPDPVSIRLPRGHKPSFPLALADVGEGGARAGIVKDAGDDPDVTHGATVIAAVAWAATGTGIGFRAGEGVGTVTRAGLPLAVGEPAINPAPRAMIAEALIDLAEANGAPPPDLVVTISIPGGERPSRFAFEPQPGRRRGARRPAGGGRRRRRDAGRGAAGGQRRRDARPRRPAPRGPGRRGRPPGARSRAGDALRPHRGRGRDR